MVAKSGPSCAARAVSDENPLPPDDPPQLQMPHAEIEDLYRWYAGPLARRAARRSGPDGPDVVHEAFARILSLGRLRFASIAAPRAYVGRVCGNIQEDNSRARSVREAWLEDLYRACSPSHDQVVYLETRDTLRRLERALTRLKPITRDVFVARRVEGRSYAEIAELTGLSPKAIEKHMARAIAKLGGLMDRG